MKYTKYIDPVCDLALAGGEKILEIYATDFETVIKVDGSSVTQADRLAEEVIVAGLQALAPKIPVLAEEAASAGHIPELGEVFFLVDPLDGTKEFVDRTGQFTVNIALIEQGRPVLGVVYVPVTGKMYTGVMGQGAFLQIVPSGTKRQAAAAAHAIHARQGPPGALTALVSRSHCCHETQILLDKWGVAEKIPAGSSLKFCHIAEGKADVYPRLGRTMEWDTGAGQGVLEAAGGNVFVLTDGQEAGPLTYGKQARGYDNPSFVAWGKK